MTKINQTKNTAKTKGAGNKAAGKAAPSKDADLKTGSETSTAKDIMNPATPPKLNPVSSLSLTEAEIIGMTTRVKNNKSVTTVQLAFLTDAQCNDALKTINALMSTGSNLLVDMAPHQLDLNKKDVRSKKQKDIFDEQIDKNKAAAAAKKSAPKKTARQSSKSIDGKAAGTA